MTYNLSLNEIFEYLNEDLVACLLVMRDFATLIENGVISSFKGYILFEGNESNIQLETKRMEGTIIFITNSGSGNLTPPLRCEPFSSNNTYPDGSNTNAIRPLINHNNGCLI
ncbi:13890_t:CDS:2 [Funneliformis mosseae]|uniref:13890_t:CDS:1 n=1 Tax=Funneliformis mosseae TaxID=27381 RepID=A0A9N9BLU3_FUNMO|nr:13890_t:CDS:2 [Funneliformis mosseae]